MDVIIIKVDCACCGCGFGIEVKKRDYKNWKNGMLAQNAFPYLPIDEIELLTNNICPDCWNEIFGEEI